MASYDLYGLPTSDLNSARATIEGVLNLHLTSHQSDWRGGEYFCVGELNEENFLLQLNVCDDDEPAEQAFPEYPLLLYVNRTNRSGVIRSLLLDGAIGVVLLKHEDI